MTWCHYPTTQIILVTLIVSAGAFMALFIGMWLPEEFTIEVRKGGASSSIVIDITGTGKKTKPLEIEETTGLNTARPQSRLVGDIEDYNWLVSISWRRYKDMEDSWEFFCPGTIIHANRVLTGNGCLKDHFRKRDILQGYVRSGSSYLFQDGLIHSINEVKNNQFLKDPFNKIFILSVSPAFNEITNLPVVLGVVDQSKADSELQFGSRVVAASWGGTQIPSEQVMKNDPFYVEEWFPADVVPCVNNVCHKIKDSDRTCCVEGQMGVFNRFVGPVSGKALIAVRRTGRPIILGMHLSHLYTPPEDFFNENDFSFLLDLAEPEFLEWLRTEVPEALYSRGTSQNFTYVKTYKLYSEFLTEEYLDDVEWFRTYNALRKYRNIIDDEVEESTRFGSGSGSGDVTNPVQEEKPVEEEDLVEEIREDTENEPTEADETP